MRSLRLTLPDQEYKLHRKMRHDEIAAFAADAAGTSFDLDSELEAAAATTF